MSWSYPRARRRRLERRAARSSPAPATGSRGRLARDAVLRLVGRRRAAVEADRLPALAAERAVKDADEIDRIQAALAVVGAGQAAARRQAIAGRSELEAWAAIRAALEEAAGTPVPVVADVVSQPTASRIGGPATQRVLASGECLLVDLAPRVGAYWGDSCVTLAVGEPTAGLRRRHAAVRDALDRALEALRPGVRAGEVDAAARQGSSYWHHTGHGIGTSYFEAPRIVPGGEEVLRPGMVVALEPADYDAASGLRLEVVALVTESACDVLSDYPLDL